MYKLTIGLPLALLLISGCGGGDDSASKTGDAMMDAADTAKQEVVEEAEALGAEGGGMMDTAMEEGGAMLDAAKDEGGAMLDEAMEAGEEMSDEKMDDVKDKAEQEASKLEEQLKDKMKLGN